MNLLLTIVNISQMAVLLQVEILAERDKSGAHIFPDITCHSDPLLPR
jgi:hypothetical protein